MQFRAEEVDPEIPIYRDPQEAFTDADERGHLRDRIRREVVQLHAVVVAQTPHGSLSDSTIHSAVCPSTFAASWPPATSRFRDSVVAVERSHAGGSMTVMGCWGAIRMGGGTRNEKQEQL
jgi:hypothetical protein